jgi:hypothetical protein
MGMSLETDILNDLQELFQEHGVQARWNGINLLVLVSRVFLSSHFLRREQSSYVSWILMLSSIALRRIFPQNVAPLAWDDFF